jgi:molybdenum cofactor cytidylyltransferase
MRERIEPIVLAAGLSTRMGQPKLLLVRHGTTLLTRTVRAVTRTTGSVPRVVVPPSGPVARLVRRHGWPVVVNPDPADGIGRSLACAVRATTADAVLVFLGDEPDVVPSVVAAVLEAAERCPAALAVSPEYRGVPGHPVLLRAALFPILSVLSGDHGARSVLRTLEAGQWCRLPIDRDPPIDIDTPEDWASWSG